MNRAIYEQFMLNLEGGKIMFDYLAIELQF